MNITPTKLNIAQLFAAANEQFVVPSYQRRYAWGNPQYMALYEDIDMLKENDGHLLGMIILHCDMLKAGVNQPEIIDGQQRMTTLILLLKAFEAVYRVKGKADKASDINKMITCKGLDDAEKPKIILGDLDNKDIEQLLQNKPNTVITNDLIKSAYNDFYTKLSSLSIEQMNNLFFKLTNVAVILRLDVSIAKDAYKLFETINNRGLGLTPTDIVKNFLLGHAAKIAEDNTLANVKLLWSNIILNLDSIDTDDFLRQFLCSVLYRKITISKLVYEFKNYYLKHVDKADLLGEFSYYQKGYDINNDEDEENGERPAESIDNKIELNKIKKVSITDFLENLVTLSEIYRKITLAEYDKPKLNRRIKNLNNINSKPAFIFLMHFIPSEIYNDDVKLSVLAYLETLMLRRHICEKRTSENDDIFSKMVLQIGKGNILEEIKKNINEEEHMPADNNFVTMLPKHQFKGKLITRAKYVLRIYGILQKRKHWGTNHFI